MNWIIGAWIAIGMVWGWRMPPAANLQSSTAMYLHVPMAVTMLLLFIASAWNGARWLKTRQPWSDMLSLSLAEAGTACGLIAMLTGSVWAGANWNSYWSWDPQQIGIVGTLLTYGALFALRSAVEDDDRKRDLWAVYAIFGAFAAIFLTYVFRKLQGGSLHPDNTLTKSSKDYLWALWFNVVGYAMLMTRLAYLRARLERVSLQLKESAYEQSAASLPEAAKEVQWTPS